MSKGKTCRRKKNANSHWESAIFLALHVFVYDKTASELFFCLQPAIRHVREASGSADGMASADSMDCTATCSCADGSACAESIACAGMRQLQKDRTASSPSNDAVLLVYRKYQLVSSLSCKLAVSKFGNIYFVPSNQEENIVTQ